MKASTATLVEKERSFGKVFNLWGVEFWGEDQKGVLGQIEKWIKNDKRARWVATVNPEFMMAAEEDTSFKEILKKTDLNVVDGIGLAWALEVVKGKSTAERLGLGWRTGLMVLRGEKQKELTPGCELLGEMIELAAKKGYKVFFLGGYEDRAKRTMERFFTCYPKLAADYSPGRPTESDEAVMKKINGFGADMVFVALGMKKQEEWILKNLPQIKKGVVMGVGRSFDYLSGDLKRAPWGWRKMGLEWLYSLLKEPKRLRRQLRLPAFIWKVISG